MIIRAVRQRRARLHVGVDHAFARALPPGSRLYEDGFGDLAQLDALVRDIETPRPIEAAVVRWSPARTVLGLSVRRGVFDSPAADRLPPEARLGRVERWDPIHAAPGAPICLAFAATGEEGFSRRRALAFQLARRGIGTWMLENPFYGSRRPRHQRGAFLRTVAEQFAMNSATVEEARALLARAHADGHRVGATGYSQGGMMAAFAAALSDFPVAVAPRGAARAAGPIFVGGVLTRTMRWDRLAAEAGGLEAARARFSSYLAPVRLDRFPPPRAPEQAVLLAARHDGFVPPAEAEALHAHWPGSTLRWVPAGHVTAVVLHGSAQLAAVLDAFGKGRA